MKNKRLNSKTQYLVGIGLFSAMTYIVDLIVRIPVQFLTFEAKDAVICIAAFLYGPLSSIIISLITCFIEFMTIGDTGVYGFLMNFISASVFSFTASFIYKKYKKFSGAIIGTYSAVALTTLVMLLANYFITPLYLGAEKSDVVAMIPTVLLPFNLAKFIMDAAIVLILYKPLVITLSKAHLIADHELSTKFSKRYIISIAIALISIAIAITIFVLLKN